LTAATPAPAVAALELTLALVNAVLALVTAAALAVVVVTAAAQPITGGIAPTSDPIHVFISVNGFERV
jgi:hypothetical protein